jgi:hypothetical protein
MAKRGPNEMAEIREGGDPYKVLKDAFSYGRHGGSDRDYTPPAQEPSRTSRAPDMAEYRASFHELKDTPVSKPLDEAAPQFRDEKAAHLNDVPNVWTRGMGPENPHPAFDRNTDRNGLPISGSRYDTKHRR